jgi:16S rRNA (guanine527-N7)-methyltransferase
VAGAGIVGAALENGGAAADAGSGAGLPGIPLAICLPHCRFTLIERMGRRAGFLRNTQAVLRLANVDVEEQEIEKAAPHRFKALTFRAFTPLNHTSVKSLFRLLAPDGVLLAYKGRKDAIDKELAPLLTPNSLISAEITPVHVPFLDEERHIVALRQVSPTHPQT